MYKGSNLVQTGVNIEKKVDIGSAEGAKIIGAWNTSYYLCMLIKRPFKKLRKLDYHKHMLHINGEIYFKSINEKYALTFPIFTVWHKKINVYMTLTCLEAFYDILLIYIDYFGLKYIIVLSLSVIEC